VTIRNIAGAKVYARMLYFQYTKKQVPMQEKRLLLAGMIERVGLLC
jgi:hypothetical protein